MLTRLLHQCGLDLGAERDLMPAAEDNPDGFWENLRFVQLNDEILNAVGAAWDLPPLTSENFKNEGLQPIRAKARLLIDQFQTDSVWGWKDPRSCLTLPFWQDLLPGLKTVIIIRNPLEVAYSMQKRNGTSYALALRLWEIYNRRLLSDAQSSDRLITHYQAFFDDPRAELLRVANFIGLEEQAVESAASLVAVHRRHTTFTIEQLIDAGISAQIVSLYQSLIGETPLSIPGDAPPEQSGADPLAGAKSRLNFSIPEAEDVRRELATLRGDALRHQEEINRYQKTIDGLRDELVTKAVHATGEINRRDGRIEELQNTFERETGRLHHEADRLRERFTQTNQLLQRTSIRLAEFEERNASLTERLRKQLQEIKRLVRILDQFADAASALRRSRRWKMANPFGALLAALTGKPLQGFGHIDKNVEKYRSWRSDHPEVDRLADEIQSLRPREIPWPSTFSESEKKNAHRPATEADKKPPKPVGPIEFPSCDQVEVSIIIPAYNQLEYTLACLASVQNNTEGIDYEVIVVDDSSNDKTPDLLGKVKGLTYLRSESNSGFIASCNRGAQAARGSYLVFLNNDTTVTPGWLTALRDTFAFEPKAGLVGSKLVYPDGRLQEAGGVIWRDGSGWNRGKFQDPHKPEYNYLREVDYCSGASVMMPKALFERLGGFDKKYAPAYYEDTDLAFKIAQYGLKVLYQPLSVVVHYEGISSGIDTSSGVKQYQEVNRSTFTSTWAEALAARPENGDLETYDAPPAGKKRILVIDHHLPMADRDSGSLRMFNILSILQQLGHQVSFIPDNLADLPPYGDKLRQRGIRFLHYPFINSVRDYLQADGKTFDFIILSRCDFARKHIAHVREYAPQSRLIFDTVDLHFLREQRQAELTNKPQDQSAAEEKRRLEYDLIDQADQTWVVSPVELDLLRSVHPDKSIEVISNIVDIPGSATPFSQRQDILFIGSFQHPPNTDAVLFFTHEIFPLVRDRLPGINFYVIGDKAPPEIMALADEHIILTGFQPDVRIFFDTIRLSVAPLRFGAGVKGKINQSMGFGVPVVATSIAAEGMELRDHEDVLIADNPDEFAAALLELYETEELWGLVSRNAIKKTMATFSREAAQRQLSHLLSDDHLNSIVASGQRLEPSSPDTVPVASR
ncbi:hypothetical protein BH20VER3_BH20VER3_08510 [soil metagenome]